MASNKQEFKKGFLWKISLYLATARQPDNFRSKLIELKATVTTKVTYRKLAIHFGLRKSSRQRLATKVVKTEPELIFLMDEGINHVLRSAVFAVCNSSKHTESGLISLVYHFSCTPSRRANSAVFWVTVLSGIWPPFYRSR